MISLFDVNRRFLTFLMFIIAIFLLNIQIFPQDNMKEEISNNPSNARKRFEWFYQQRAYPKDTVEQGYLFKAYEKIRDYPIEKTIELNWQAIGPQPGSYYSYGSVAGRIPAMVVHPSNSSIVYIGAADGGVWKTIDGGSNWNPMTDFLPTLATGSMAIDRNNPETIYWGTGEPYYSGDAYGGAGIFKTTNGGSSWTSIGLSNEKRIPALALDPNNPNILFAGTWNGIYRTTNGGANWTKTLSYGYGYEVVSHPTNSSILYAGVGDNSTYAGVYKSNDNGVTWTKLTNGLPASSSINRLKIDISKSSPSTIYVLMSSKSPFGGLLGLYKSTNDGATWTQVSGVPSSLFNSQGWYNIMVGIHPTNPNIVFIGGINIYRTNDGGSLWTNVSGNTVHVDQHSIGFGNGVIYVGNDGGVYKSNDNGSSWLNVNASLAVTQFYSVGLDKLTPNRIYGGTQDNGTQRSSGNKNWTGVIGGDGGMIVVDYTNSNVVYGETQYGSVYKSTNGGTSFSSIYNVSGAWITPLRLHPTNNTTIYSANSKVIRSLDGGYNWNPISSDLNGTSRITWLTIHPVTPTTLYASSQSKIFKTIDDGANWNLISSGLPNRTVTQVVVDPNITTTVYALYSGTGGGHVYKSVDGGTNWLSITGDLPDLPVNTLAVHPDNSNKLYIGTDLGVFVTTNGGSNWLKENSLPNVAVIDMSITSDNYLVASTHGRSMFKASLDITPNPNLTVISPNGGETWMVGSTQTIRWNSNYLSGNVKIELSRNGGTTYETLFSNTSNDGLETWTVNGSVTNSAKIQITSLDNQMVSDISDNVFNISNQSITVFSPNGGENWFTGTNQTIQWTSTNVSGNVKIELSRDGGSTFETLYASTQNDGSETWTVTGSPSSAAKIKISSVDVPLVNDLSNNGFNIIQQSITVQNPNGGEEWGIGNSHNISWNSSGISGNVKIELSRNNGATYETLFEDTQNDGSENWNVNGNVTTSALIKITSKNTSSVFDISNNTFSIVQPTLTVTSPNGNEVWFVGSVQNIKWNSTNLSGNVNIELSRDGGSTYEVLFSNVTNNGSKSWEVSGPSTTNALVRLSSATLSNVFDISDNVFKILEQSITVVSPNGGEVWALSSKKVIQWSSINVTGNVKIEISRNGGSNYKTLFASTPNDGSEVWTVNNPTTSSALIKISSIENPSVLDVSNNYFTIMRIKTSPQHYATDFEEQTYGSSNEETLPENFALKQNYPNPFNPTTLIKYQLPVNSRVTLKIFNLLGQEVKMLVDEIQDIGFKSVEWNAVDNSGKDVASGLYIYKITAYDLFDPNNSFTQLKRMILLK